MLHIFLSESYYWISIKTGTLASIADTEDGSLECHLANVASILTFLSN